MAYRMVLNETAWFGAGTIAHIVDKINRRGYRKGLVVTDKVLRDCGVVDKVTTLLEDNNLEYALFDEVMPNPTIWVVKKAWRRSDKATPIIYCRSAAVHRRIPVKP